MKTLQSLLNQHQPLISFEIFPPKTPPAKQVLFENLKILSSLSPDFISVTMGAMGSARENTFEIVEHLIREHQILGVAHLTCVNTSQKIILEMLEQLKKTQIRNLLCLRGDPPVENGVLLPITGDFQHAADLIRFIREQTGDYFCIGVAGYPEGHVESESLESDLEYLKQKVDAGANFIITQLFFENRDYFQFVERARSIGIFCKIIPGIMPVTNVAQLERFTKICGAKIPEELHVKLLSVKTDPQNVKQCGIEYATRQCRELLGQGAPGLHFYVLNQAESVQKILSGISLQHSQKQAF